MKKTILFIFYSFIIFAGNLQLPQIVVQENFKMRNKEQTRGLVRNRFFTKIDNNSERTRVGSFYLIEPQKNSENKMVFNLFDDIKMIVVIDSVEENNDGIKSYVGKVDNDLLQSVVITQDKDGKILAIIDDYSKNKSFRVFQNLENITVEEIDLGIARAGMYGITINSADKNESLVLAKSISPNLNRNRSSSTTIDVLIVFDAKAQIYANKKGGIISFAQNMINKMNTALINSEITETTFKLAGTMNHNSTFTGGNMDIKAWSDLLYYIIGNDSPNNIAPYKDIRDKRVELKADIVVTLVHSYSGGSGILGVGSAYTQNQETTFASDAYNLVKIDAAENGHTLTHEVGHNIGLGHSRSQKDYPGPQYFVNNSSTDYSAAYQNKATSSYTIMAYNYDGPQGAGTRYATELPRFSAPSPATYSNFGMVGEELANNTRMFKENWQKVANFSDSFVSAGDEIKLLPNPISEKGGNAILQIKNSFSTPSRFTLKTADNQAILPNWITLRNHGYFDAGKNEGVLAPNEKLDIPAIFKENTGEKREVTILFTMFNPQSNEIIFDSQLTIEQSGKTISTLTLNFDANGGEGIMGPQIFKEGQSQKILANSFTNATYSFVGWGISPTENKIYDDGQEISLSEDIKFYAIWECNLVDLITKNSTSNFNNNELEKYRTILGSGNNYDLAKKNPEVLQEVIDNTNLNKYSTIIEVDAGWNLVSSPVNNCILFESKNHQDILELFLFDTEKKIYEKIQKTTAITASSAFFIYSENKQTIVLRGDYPETTADFIFKNGWNMFGAIKNKNSPLKNDVSNYGLEILFEYKSNNVYQEVDFSQSNSLKVGKGYWGLKF